ncbi:hypothetical protein [Paludibacterium denitrificans]|uniref:Uncharacterized protein n=1 Tax=Paludibacterium denitrificans TaxID=2675226 RepID=A0A844GCQ0_9NEIS|nr:hypothetical protein [Paludibacterium denitrificans]MTD32544.1 hypothetical protein [Paludibacterium denitrificans]
MLEQQVLAALSEHKHGRSTKELAQQLGRSVAELTPELLQLEGQNKVNRRDVGNELIWQFGPGKHVVAEAKPNDKQNVPARVKRILMGVGKTGMTSAQLVDQVVGSPAAVNTALQFYRKKDQVKRHDNGHWYWVSNTDQSVAKESKQARHADSNTDTEVAGKGNVNDDMSAPDCSPIPLIGSIGDDGTVELFESAPERFKVLFPSHVSGKKPVELSPSKPKEEVPFNCLLDQAGWLYLDLTNGSTTVLSPDETDQLYQFLHRLQPVMPQRELLA